MITTHAYQFEWVKWFSLSKLGCSFREYRKNPDFFP